MFILGIILFMLWSIPMGIILTTIKLVDREDEKLEERKEESKNA